MIFARHVGHSSQWLIRTKIRFFCTRCREILGGVNSLRLQAVSGSIGEQFLQRDVTGQGCQIGAFDSRMERSEARHFQSGHSIAHSPFFVADGNYARAQSHKVFGCGVPLLVQRKSYCTQCFRLCFIATLAGIRNLSLKSVKLDLQSAEDEVLPSNLLVRRCQLLSSLLHLAAC